MPLQRKFYLIFIFLSALCFHEALAQEQDLFLRADSLFEAGAFREASLAYERVYFLHNDHELRARANLGRAQSLRALKEWDMALTVLGRTRFQAISDELHYQIRAERVLLRYLNGQWRAVPNELNQIRFFLPEEPRTEHLVYLQILALHEMEFWEDARSLSEKHFSHLAGYARLEEVYASEPDFLNANRAGWIATFFPGGGQLYAGAWQEGLVSATLQLGALGWMGYNFWTGYYATGILTGGGVFQAVYFGSTDRAQRLAERENHNRKVRYNRILRSKVLALEEDRRSGILQEGQQN